MSDAGVNKTISTVFGAATVTCFKRLGRGTFGSVYQGAVASVSSGFPEDLQHLVGQHVAIKKCPQVFEESKNAYTSFFTEQNDSDKSKRFVGHKGFSGAACFREITYLRMTKPCPYIIDLYFVGKLKSSVYVVLEYMDGTLDDNISTWMEDRPSPEEHRRLVKVVGHDVASALMFMHDRGILHRDVKPENILFSTHPETHETVFKLADFGLSRPRLRYEYMTVQDCMTSYFRSPEIIMYDGRYTTACDVWGLGVTLLQLMRLVYIPWDRNDKERMPSELSSTEETLAAILAQVGSPSDMMIDQLFDSVGSPRRVNLQETIERESDKEETIPAERRLRGEIEKFFGRENTRVITAIERCLKVNPEERTTAANVARQLH